MTTVEMFAVVFTSVSFFRLCMVYGCCYGLSFMVNELFMGMVNECILWFGYGYGFAYWLRFMVLVSGC